jgi:SAM-dependent methyltransferase
MDRQVHLATDLNDLSDIAYGFMASKALVTALEIGLFSRLAAGPGTAAELAAITGRDCRRLRTLLRALAALGLVTVEEECYANAPASEQYLVRGGRRDLGDYYRLQIGRQLYPALLRLDDGLAGTGTAFDTLGGLMADPAQARTFTVAQHAGSRGAARALADRLPLDGARRLLDVGGGSGAFTIALCRRRPALRSTVLDFPAVLDVAREYVDKAGLTDRVTLVPGDALDLPWPQDQDVVLLSYLLSALGDGDGGCGHRRGSEIDAVLRKAHACLRPGGLLVVHDFVLDDDGPGPRHAALWFLQYLAYRPDGESFTAGELRGRLRGAGFDPDPARELIPGITSVILARKDESR